MNPSPPTIRNTCDAAAAEPLLRRIIADDQPRQIMVPAHRSGLLSSCIARPFALAKTRRDTMKWVPTEPKTLGGLRPTNGRVSLQIFLPHPVRYRKRAVEFAHRGAFFFFSARFLENGKKVRYFIS